jgi:hypothetical protein
MLYKLSADRPILEQKKLGPFTFNIEIKKSQPHQAEGLAQARGSSEDYGHLPGYIGPDGDSLDFFVGDRHDGQIYSYKKQQKLNERGERDPNVPWKTTDVKFVVGHGPDEAAKFHAGMAGWTTPTLRYVKDKSFRDWAALEKHMNRHYKVASDSTLYDHPVESWLRARHEGVADWHITKDVGREYSASKSPLDAFRLWQGLDIGGPDKDARQRFNEHYDAWAKSQSFSPAGVVSNPHVSSLWSFMEEPGARADVFEHPQGGAFLRYSFPSQRKDYAARTIYHLGQLFHPDKAALEQVRDAVLRDPLAHADKLDTFLTSRLPPAVGGKQPKLTDALSQLTSADLLEMHGLPAKRTTTDYPKPPTSSPPTSSPPTSSPPTSPRWGRRAAIGAATAASLYGIYRGGRYLYDRYMGPSGENNTKTARHYKEDKMKTATEAGFFTGLSDGVGASMFQPISSVKYLVSPQGRYQLGLMVGVPAPPAAFAALSAYGLYRGGKHLYDKYTTPSPVTEEPKLAASISARQRFGLLRAGPRS